MEVAMPMEQPFANYDMQDHHHSTLTSNVTTGIT